MIVKDVLLFTISTRGSIAGISTNHLVHGRFLLLSWLSNSLERMLLFIATYIDINADISQY